MKKLIAFIICMIVLAGATLSGAVDPLNIPLKKLLSSPNDKAKVVFEIPIEVKILDVSKDFDWYKVNISFKLGPFEQSHTGWVKIPFDEILLAHQ